MQYDMHTWRAKITGSKHRTALPIMTYPGLDRIGVTITQAVQDGAIHSRAVCALANVYPAIAATSIMDLALEAEAFGSPIRFSDDEVPSATTPIVNDPKQIDALEVPALTSGRLPAFFEACRTTCATLTDRPVFAGCIGPFSLAGRLYGMTEIMTAILMDPPAIGALLEKTTALLVACAREYKRLGANGLLIAEPAAGMLSAPLCDEFSSAWVSHIVNAVQDEGFLVILHNCGNTTGLVDSMLSTKAAGLHFGNSADMVERLRAIPSNRLVLGNIDPVALRTEPPEKISLLVRSLLRDTAAFPHFVLSTGCDTPPCTPKKGIDAFFHELAVYNHDV